MRNISSLAIVLIALLLGACSARTYQRTETTPDGISTTKRNTGPFHDHTSEEFDSTIAYRNCLSDMNRRQNGVSAVDYCRQETRSNDRKRQNLRNGEAPGGTSMMGPGQFGPGAMMGSGGYGRGGYGVGGYPMYQAPLGQLDYEVNPGQPSYASQSRSNGSDDDKARDGQIADTANEVRQVQERVDRLESQESSDD
jgi:hypothetical protein